MIPLIKFDLPQLSDELKNEILQVSCTIGEHVSKNTIGEIEKNAIDKNDTKVLTELNALKSLYGFDYLPQHRGMRLSDTLGNNIRKELNIPLPAKTDFVVQVINTKHTFIHNDGSRICSLYYMLTDDTATTSFYESSVDPIYGTVWNPADVKKTHTFTMQKGDWHGFNHSAIHSVNDVNKTRVGMLIDMSRAFDTYEDCMKHFEEYYAKTISL
jgi:hypothetical protein